MILVVTLILSIYCLSLWFIVKEKRYYDRIHSFFYISLILLLIQDVNTHRFELIGFNLYTHFILVGYSLYNIYRAVKISMSLRYHLRDIEATLVKWDVIDKLEENDYARLNNNKIKTVIKSKEPNRIVFISTVFKTSIADNYINDFYKKIIVKEGSCVFNLINKREVEQRILNEGQSIETNPHQEHWFAPNGETVIMEVICIKT